MSHNLRPEAKGNPNAISVRLKGRSMSNVNGQRRHDLRIGQQPDYVNDDMTKFNRVLIEPWTGTKLRAESKTRRDQKPRKRIMKSNAGIATCGIITFGNKAQKRFTRLSKKKQDEAFRAIADAIAEKLNTTLTGLVVHLDESAIHAHLQLVGYTLDGDPVSDRTKKRHTSEIQDLAAEIAQQFEPRIERGRRIKERIERGAKPHETIYRQVNILHRDLPLEIEELRAEIARLEAVKSKLERYISKIEAQEARSDRKAKRLEIYEKRLDKHNSELADREVHVRKLESTLSDLKTRKRKAEWHAKRAEKRARDAEEIERLSWKAIEDAQKQEAFAKERTPEILSPNHVDDLPAPLRDAINKSAEGRGYIPLQMGSHADDVQNIRSFLEAYIFQIAALVYQHMAKTATDLRRNWRNALKREKGLITQVSELKAYNAELASTNKALEQELAVSREGKINNSTLYSEN